MSISLNRGSLNRGSLNRVLGVLEREKNVGKMSTFKRLVWKIKKISLPSSTSFRKWPSCFMTRNCCKKNRNWQHSSQNCHDFWAIRNLFLNFKNVSNKWTCTINDELWKLYYTSEKKNLFIKLLGGHIVGIYGQFILDLFSITAFSWCSVKNACSN